MEIQKHCPNKLIVNNLPKDLHFIYVKDVKSFIGDLLEGALSDSHIRYSLKKKLETLK